MTAPAINARGMRCPWPVLRFARAVRDAQPGDDVSLLADDPKAEAEIGALADAQGWIVTCAPVEGGLCFTLRR